MISHSFDVWGNVFISEQRKEVTRSMGLELVSENEVHCFFEGTQFVYKVNLPALHVVILEDTELKI